MSIARPCIGCFLLCSSALLLVGESDAQVRKISPPSRRGPSGWVSAARITPDGREVVYQLTTSSGADGVDSFFVASDAGARRVVRDAGEVASFALSPDGRFLVWKTAPESALFGVPLSGSPVPERLTPPELRLSSGQDFSISAQGRVVFLADGDLDRQLASVALAGKEPPVRLDGPGRRGTTLRFFALSPDGHWVAYLADPEQPGRFELFLAPVTGATPARKLSGALVAGGSVHSFAFSPTSERVVYVATQDRVGSEDLHSAAVLALEPPVRLNPDLATPSHVDSFEIAPDGASVVYRHYRTGTTTLEIFRVPIAGGAAPVRLNAALVTGGRVLSFALARDGSVVYTADQEVRNREELYHVASGGTVTKINAPLTSSQDVQAFQLAPRGNRVVYSVYAGGAVATFVASLDGSVGPAVIWPGARPFSFAASGERVVYRDGQAAIGGIFGLPLDGVSAPVELLHAAPGFYPATDFQLELVGERVVSRVATTETYELFAAPVAGGAAPARLSAPVPMERGIDDAWSPALTADGRWTVFGFGPFLFSADLEHRSPPIRLHDEPLTSSPWFRIVPGNRVLYRTANKLYAVPIDGSEPPLLVDAVGTSEEIRTTPDGSRVLYLDAGRRLHSAVLDGASTPVLLGGFPAQGSVLFRDYRISADGARVVYHFEVSGESAVRLLSAPIDGSAAPVQLEPSLATAKLVDLAPGGRVVFQTPAPGPASLWSVPVDASAAPTLLATADLPLPAESDRIAVTAGRVVFLARNGALSSVPVDGSEPARGLAPGFIGWGLEAVGARAFFVARPASGGHADLYSVPVDGSAAPVRLSRASADGVFSARRVSPDGARVVYLYEQECERALYSSASDGRAEPVRLTTQPTDCKGLQTFLPDFELSPDGRTVAFEFRTYGYLLARERELDVLSEIFVVPSDGSRAPLEVNAAPPAINDFPAYRLDPASRFVLYTADQDEEDVHELYLAPLPRPRLRAVTR